MHLQKPAVVAFRTTWSLREYLEVLAVKSGLSFSDFLRMVVLLGTQKQVELLGITGIEIAAVDDPNRKKEPAYKKGKYEQQVEKLREGLKPFSDGTIPENIEELWEKRAERIRQMPSYGRSRGLTQK